MANKFKYNKTGAETDSIFKGNWAIDTTAPNSGGGPSSTTGLYNGAPIPSGGYTIYSPGSVYTATTDDDLLGKVRDLGGDWSSVSAALTWASTDPDTIILNKAFDNKITQGLVLNLDASNISSFVDSQPTVNYVNNTPSQGGWGGGYDVIDSSRKTFRFNINNFNGVAGSGQGWRSFTWNLNAYSGQAVTISATIEVPLTSPGTFAWVMMGQTNTHTDNGSGAGTYLGYSTAGERIYKSTTTKERITWSGTLGSTGTASQPSGHVGFTVWYNGGTSGVNSYITVSDVQIELHASATPFVDGTRLQNINWHDLSGNGNAISINSPTFSDNSFLFDQTNEYFSLANNALNNVTGNVTLMGVCKQGNTGYPHQTLLCTDINYRNGLKLMSRYHGPVSAWIGNSDGTDSYVLSSGVDITNDGRYHHIATTRDTSSGMLKIYVDGVLKNSVATYTGDTYMSNIAAVGVDYHSSGYYYIGNISSTDAYNIALSDTELLQNYYQAPIITTNLDYMWDAGNLVSFDPTTINVFNLSDGGSGNVSNGTLVNGVNFNKNNGGVWDFDGSDDYISIPTYTFGNGNWVLNMWVNVNNFSKAYFMSNISGGPVANVFDAYGSQIVYRNYDGAWQNHSGNTTLSTGEWYMLTWVNYAGATNQDGTMQMYVNGISDSGVFNSYTTNGGPCNIIAGYYGSTRFDGKIGNVLVYNKALTPSEVLQNFNAQRNRFGI